MRLHNSPFARTLFTRPLSRIPGTAGTSLARRPRQGCLRCEQRRGSLLVTLVLLMVAFMLVAALAIDVAQVHLVRTELRTATDAAARAAAENLSRTRDTAQARQRGIEIAAQNHVAGQPLRLADESFEFGQAIEDAETGRFDFFPGRLPTNGVRVTSARSPAGPDGTMPLLLGRIAGSEFFHVRASATATCVEADIILTLSTIGVE